MATATWGTVERPILEAINDGATATGGPDWRGVVAATGLPADKVQIALRRLYRDGWIAGFDVTTIGGTGFELLNIELLGPALEAIGVWPNEPYTELVDALSDEIGKTTDPVQKSK